MTTKFKHTKYEARELLAKTLESGEYEQGRRYLRKGDKLCCLGVACELFIKHEPDHRLTHTVGAYNVHRYGVHHGILPNIVAEWLGWTVDGRLVDSRKSLIGNKLTVLNDKGFSFKRIAKLIRRRRVKNINR